MPKLHLHIAEHVQGQFSTKGLNLLLIFQVNCPGCFMYALPVFGKLYELYSDRIGFMALSTAFEDYEYNNLENTQLLLTKGTLVGETKKAFGSRDLHQLPYLIKSPVAMDATMIADDQELLITYICHTDPNFELLSEIDKSSVKSRVRSYLNKQETVSMTFTANQFRGTPTIVLYDQDHNIVDSWFGHVPIERIIDTIENS